MMMPRMQGTHASGHRPARLSAAMCGSASAVAVVQWLLVWTEKLPHLSVVLLASAEVSKRLNPRQ